jgi:hypothetical protein
MPTCADPSPRTRAQNGTATVRIQESDAFAIQIQFSLRRGNLPARKDVVDAFMHEMSGECLGAFSEIFLLLYKLFLKIFPVKLKDDLR